MGLCSVEIAADSAALYTVQIHAKNLNSCSILSHQSTSVDLYGIVFCGDSCRLCRRGGSFFLVVLCSFEFIFRVLETLLVICDLLLCFSFLLLQALASPSAFLFKLWFLSFA